VNHFDNVKALALLQRYAVKCRAATVKLSVIVSAAVMVCVSAVNASAGPADVIPADALAAVVWPGMNDDTPGFADSKFKAMLEATGLGETIPGTMIKIFEADPRLDEDFLGLQLWKEVYPVLWRRPWAVYYQGNDWRPNEHGYGQEVPKFGFIIEPGQDKAAAEKWLAQIRDLIDGEFPELNVALVDDGELMGLVVASEWADPDGEAAVGLKAAPRFSEALGTLNLENPSAWVYVDAQGLIELFHEMVDNTGNANDLDLDEIKKTFDDNLAAQGLDTLDRIIWAGGFSGRDWQQALFIAAPAPRRGLLSLLDQPEIDESQFGLVPGSVAWVRLSRFDLAEAWDVLVGVATAIDPEAVDEVAEFRHGFIGVFSFDLVDDLLDPLGDTWTFYSDPAFGGMFGTRVGLIHPADDPARIEQTLTKIEAYINDQLEREGMPFRFVVNERDGFELHTLTLPFVAPSWAVVDGRLMVGLSQETVLALKNSADDPEHSLLAEFRTHPLERYFDTQPGAHLATSMTYADLSQTAPDHHMAYAMLLNLWAMSAGGELAFNPVELLPELSQLTPHLGTMAGLAWMDDAGYHQRSISPFPGSSLLSPEVVLGNATSMPMLGVWTGTMLPVIGANRRVARRMQSFSNLRVISVGLAMYANDHKGSFPETLGELYAKDYVDNPDVFTAPDDPEQVLIDGPVSVEAIDLINQKGSYVLVTPGLKVNEVKDPTQTIVVVEHPRFWRADGTHSVGFADAHVETRNDPQQTLEDIKQQTGRTLDQIIAAQVDRVPGDEALDESALEVEAVEGDR